MGRGWLLLATPPLLALVTALDSAALAARTRGGQGLATVCTLLFWAALVRASGRRLRWLMVLGLVAATAGEAIFSLGLGMYRYRLAAIPAYVPPGHTVLYAAIFVFARLRAVRTRAWVPFALLAADAAYTACWYRAAHDVFGLACFAVFVGVWLLNRGARSFFAAMYLLVAFLEQCGTRFGCWRWPEVLLGKIAAVPSANPPSGVALFYVLFDLACVGLYTATHWAAFERGVRLRVKAAR